MHKQNFVTQPRDWPTTSEEVWRFDENFHATGRPSTAPNGENEPLHLGSSSANADAPPILEAVVCLNHSDTASGHPDIGLSIQSDVLGSHWHTECGTSDNGDTVSLWAPVLPISQWRLGTSASYARGEARQGEKLIDACVQPNDGNCGPSVMVWGTIHHGGRSKLVVVDGAMNWHWYIQILRNQMLPWATGLFRRNFVYIQDNAPPHTACDTAATECGTSDNGDTVSLWAPVLPISQWRLGTGASYARGEARQGEKLIDACVQPNDGNCGPSVMVWGTIHHGGRSKLVVVDGAMNWHWYIQILRNQMLPWATGLFRRNFVYIQDNAPPHTACDTAATECGTSDNGDTVSLWAPVLPISQWRLGTGASYARGEARQGEQLIDACVQPNDGNCGPSVMVWGTIHHGGRSKLVVVDGAMNWHWYIQILRNQMLPWATGLFRRNFVYIQDNAPPHTACDTAAFLDQQDV